jgi:endoribonuclease Dicer
MMNTLLVSAQVVVARKFQTTILSLLIHKERDSIKKLLEMQASPGVVYLVLPLVSGKIDWCSIKFYASSTLEVTDKDVRHYSSCNKDTNLVQTKDGPLCPCMLQHAVVCTPHNGMLYTVSGFLDLNANSLMRNSAISYKTHFKTRYLFLSNGFFMSDMF